MRKKSRVLVVDDDDLLRLCLADWLKKDGYRTDTACNGEEALAKLQTSTFDLLLVDIVMPVMDGIGLLENVRAEDPDVPIVMMTAHGSIDSAVDAMKKGASDYLQKPFDPRQLWNRIEQAEEKRRLVEEHRNVKQQLERLSLPFELLGRSRSMLEVFDLIDAVAPTDSTVLISGESGTGKEMVAREVHRRSRRASGPFIAVNFGALPESLAESELFGHEKGAFTGAIALKKGVMELANGGTLFLDEIGDAAPKIQIDLLRVLEERRFFRLGGNQPVDVDIRIVAATNRPLEKAIADGNFRSDLYYRLNVVRINVPPLRDRRDDIPVLADKFLREFSADMKKGVAAISPETARILATYDWPGNVRELKNAIERAVVVAKGSRIIPEDLPVQVEKPQDGASQGTTLEAIEKAHIAATLAREDWNISRAAELLGIDRSTLYAKIKKYDLAKA